MQSKNLEIHPRFAIPVDGKFQPTAPPALFLGSDGKSSLYIQGRLERIRARFNGPGISAIPKGPIPPPPYILVGLPRDHAELRKLKAKWSSKLTKGGLGDEGYLIDISKDRICLVANEPAGLVYGLQALLERVTDDGIPCGIIADRPSLAWRGMHVIVGGHSSMPGLRKLLTEHLPALRINRLILEINYGFEFKSHPELNSPGALTLEDCRELKREADQNGVQLIPMINCLGHQSWAKTTGKLLQKHPEFDETPDLPPDNPGIYCRSWCPLHPEVNNVVFALMDELIDAFGAKAFHVGMDEVFILGKCDRCRGKNPSELFATSVKDIHHHLVDEKHVEMYMWGDRFLDGVATKYGEWEASTNSTHPAVDLVPKDIVICDWHYETPADFPSVPYFQQKGFRLIPSGWNQVENVKLLTASLFANRGPRMMGYLATTWGNADRVVSALEGKPQPQTGRRRNTDLAESIRLGARTAWQGLPSP